MNSFRRIPPPKVRFRVRGANDAGLNNEFSRAPFLWHSQKKHLDHARIVASINNKSTQVNLLLFSSMFLHSIRKGK